jgi:hypothetical protein
VLSDRVYLVYFASMVVIGRAIASGSRMRRMVETHRGCNFTVRRAETLSLQLTL